MSAAVHLENFLLANQVKTGDAYNIIDQRKGIKSLITADPWKLETDTAGIQPEHKKSINSKLDYLFYMINRCYAEGEVLHICERQYYSLDTAPADIPPSTIDEHINHVAQLRGISVNLEEPVETPAPAIRTVTKSCIEWDFDIYQNVPQRLISEHNMVEVVKRITMATANIFSFEDMEDMLEEKKSSMWLRINVAIMDKPEPRRVTQESKIQRYKTNELYKDSFRVRVYVKTTKAEKCYIRAKLLEDDNFTLIFRTPGIVNSVEDIVDKGTFSNPIMLLGSAKRDAVTYSDIRKIYNVYVLRTTSGNIIVDEPQLVTSIGKFREQISDPKKSKTSTTVRLVGNLPYELSLCHTSTIGTIKKITPVIRSELIADIGMYESVSSQPGNLELNLNAVNEQIEALTISDRNAKFIDRLINCLSPERASDYLKRRSIVIGLANMNLDYMPLAIKFCMLCPERFTKDYRKSMKQIEDAWQNAKQQKFGDSNHMLHTLRGWAKQDNMTEYRKITQINMYDFILDKVKHSQGDLSHKSVAVAMRNYMGDVLFSATGGAKNTDIIWYEFVLPEDTTEHDMHISYYKWRRCEGLPLKIYKFVTEYLPGIIKGIMDFSASEADKTVQEDKAKAKAKASIQQNLLNIIKSLENNGTLQSIYRQSSMEMRREGVGYYIDNNEHVRDYIGVKNGIVQLLPHVKLIQGYHTLLITRSTKCEYEEWNPHNCIHREVERSIDVLFGDKTDAAKFMKIVLAMSLSGRPRTPTMLYYLFGEGSNGKTYIMELHSNALGTVTEMPHGGYANNLKLSFLTESIKDGTDTTLMSNEHARFMYITEGYPGMQVRIENIKRLTDKVSGNEKYEKHKVIKINSDVFLASNHNGNISGRDHGTWRRIVIIPFNMRLTPNPNPNNKNEILEDRTLISHKVNDPTYLSAYLAMLVKYYKIFTEEYNGDISKVLQECPTIRDATDTYRESQDYVYRFYKSTFVVKPSQKPISLERIQERFISWCRSNQIQEYSVNEDMHYLKKIVYRGSENFVGNSLLGHIMLEVGQLPEEVDTTADLLETMADAELSDDDFN